MCWLREYSLVAAQDTERVFKGLNVSLTPSLKGLKSRRGSGPGHEVWYVLTRREGQVEVGGTGEE